MLAPNLHFSFHSTPHRFLHCCRYVLHSLIRQQKKNMNLSLFLLPVTLASHLPATLQLTCKASREKAAIKTKSTSCYSHGLPFPRSILVCVFVHGHTSVCVHEVRERYKANPALDDLLYNENKGSVF